MTEALSNWLVVVPGSGNNFDSSLNSLFSFSLRLLAALRLFSFISANKNAHRDALKLTPNNSSIRLIELLDIITYLGIRVRYL